MGGHPGKVWLAPSLDNTKLEKQSSAALPNHIHVGTNEQTTSASFFIKIPERKSCLYWRPMYGMTKPTVCCSLVLCRGKTAVGLLSVRWCVALNGDDMDMGECGHGAKAQQIHTVTRWLQQACRWCSCIDPVPLPFLSPYLALCKS